MVNTQITNFQEKLASAFGEGFANATRALEQMTRHTVAFEHFHSGYLKLNASALPDDLYKLYNSGCKTLLTTEIFGDVTGKSYLLLSDKDQHAITQTIPVMASSADLTEEFLKELDNILSAAVITKLSNQLSKKMFGDVPVMVGETRSRIVDIIQDDFLEDTEDVYISSASFSIGNDLSVRPLFLWVLDCSKIEMETVKV